MTILNQREYRLAKSRAAYLKATRSSQSISESAVGLTPEVVDVRLEAIQAEYTKLMKDIAAYEQLWGKETPSLDELAAADLGLLPIIGRIARGWSQKQLAEELGLKEQQIQRYESERYSSISLSRFDRIMTALGAKLEVTFREPRANSDTAPDRAPSTIKVAVLKEVQRRNWLGHSPNVAQSEFLESLREYIGNGMELSKGRTFYRRKIRGDSKCDEAALLLWQAYILSSAASQAKSVKAKFDIADSTWLRDLVKLSVRPDGPLLAVRFLREKGIIVVVEPQLPQTSIDGAALLLSQGTPVIGLTLRFDRLDYFWFTLMHEIGHLFLHFYKGLDTGFIDNLEVEETSDLEREADSFARSSLIPDEAWQTAPVRFSRSIGLAKGLADQLGIHVAIVAGRIRKERGDFAKLSEWVGQGEVRKLFYKS